MLTETGRVLAVDEDGLWVETHKQSACAQCSAKQGCGQSLLAESALKDMTVIKAYFNTLAQRDRVWQVGASVAIGIDERALVRGALTAYLLPLILMLAGAWLGQMLLGELFSVLFALLGLGLGALALRWRSVVAPSVELRPLVLESQTEAAAQ